MARLALYGPGARRLHEEIITVTARWHDANREEQPLEPYGETGEQTTIQQLQDALENGVVASDEMTRRASKWVARDVDDLRPYVEARRGISRDRALEQLARNAAEEADALHDLLNRQLARIERERRDFQQPQMSLDFRTDEEREQDERERRQREADRRSWDDKIARLQAELESEPQRVRDSYSVRAERLDPIGLVYLWPAG